MLYDTLSSYGLIRMFPSQMPDCWDMPLLTGLPCHFLRETLGSLNTLHGQGFPNVDRLNLIFAHRHPHNPHRFIRQIADEAEDYYENVIARKRQIPTRPDNWHDLLNALIWLQFPASKALISQFHAKDIADFGLSPRTPRRDRLTHFDECGVLLLVKEKHAKSLDVFFAELATHRWRNVFLVHRAIWHDLVTPCIFGHATLEMLLNPFVGITAKWLAVIVDNGFKSMNADEKHAHIDQQLAKTLARFQGFISKQVLRPIPVLGIPGWHSNQDADFYGRTDYFRPQRSGVPLSAQCPIWQESLITESLTPQTRYCK